MVSEILIENEHDLREFYEWLLSRARENERAGNISNAQLYKKFADKIKKQMADPDSDPI